MKRICRSEVDEFVYDGDITKIVKALLNDKEILVYYIIYKGKQYYIVKEQILTFDLITNERELEDVYYLCSEKELNMLKEIE